MTPASILDAYLADRIGTVTGDELVRALNGMGWHLVSNAEHRPITYGTKLAEDGPVSDGVSHRLIVHVDNEILEHAKFIPRLYLERAKDAEQCVRWHVGAAARELALEVGKKLGLPVQ